MISALVYNLIIPAVTFGLSQSRLKAVLLIITGILLGSLFIWLIEKYLTEERLERRFIKKIGTRTEILLFVAMSFHSIPEGVAVGVGYDSAFVFDSISNFGHYIAIAIAIHNIPEGLAVSIPFRSNGASVRKCFFVAFLTSLPQPIAAIPASMLVWLFKPLLIPFLGFAAGAMIYLVIFEIIPHALIKRNPTEVAWAFVIGFCSMLAVQIFL